MNRDYKFKVGQKIRIKPEGEDEYKFGIVEDKNRDSIFVKMDNQESIIEINNIDYKDVSLCIELKRK